MLVLEAKLTFFVFFMFTKVACNKEFCDLCHIVQKKIFFSVHLPKGETLERKKLSESYILAVCEGEISLDFITYRAMFLRTGDLLVLPKSLHVKCTAVTSCQFILCALAPDINVCKYFSPKHLEAYLSTRPEIVSNIRNQNKLFPLHSQLDGDMLRFLHRLDKSLYTPINCCSYQLFKREELFLYLRIGYEKEDLAYFFYPIMFRDMEFRDFIFENFRDTPDVNLLAEKANMSVRTFTRKFKETFLESPHKWILARKAEFIENDIVRSNLSFNEIANKYNFSSPAYLSNFCKKLWGKTPTDMRKHGLLL